MTARARLILLGVALGGVAVGVAVGIVVAAKTAPVPPRAPVVDAVKAPR